MNNVFITALKKSHLSKLNYLFAILTITFASSCGYRNVYLPPDIKVIIEKSNNQDELKKLIYHYSQRKEDSLKLKSAYFLVKNIIGQTSLDSIPFEKNKIYFDALQHLSESKGEKLATQSEIRAVLDSVNSKSNAIVEKPNIVQKNDIDNISADMLINNIDLAFAQWAKVGWANHFTFEDFLQSVLPYKCSNTYMGNMRSLFIAKYQTLLNKCLINKEDSYAATQIIISKIDSTYMIRPSLFISYPYLHPMKFSDIVKGKIGTCYDVVSVKVNILRSLGVPVVFDQVPCWGNSNDKHYFVKEISNKFSSRQLFTNDQQVQFGKIFDFNRKADIAHVFFRNDTLSHLTDLPKGVTVRNSRTIPKVFRLCFNKQLNSLAAIKKPNDEIPEYFENDRLKDVTEEYIVNSDIKLTLDPLIPNQKYAYLCCFDNLDWKVAAWAKIENGKSVTFSKIGRNVVYLPTYYKKGAMIAAGLPFLINNGGNIRTFAPDTRKKHKLKLLLKFPFRSTELRYPMLKSWFNVANKPDFSDTSTVYKINKLPFYTTEATLKRPIKARYLFFRYCVDKSLQKTEYNVDAMLSKLEFWGIDKKGEQVLLKGKPFGNPGIYGHKRDAAFDDDILSYFQNDPNKEPFIGIDLGSKNEVYLNKIIYCTKNDDNRIVSGDQYELFIWRDGNWRSFGIEKAKDNSVDFDNVPVNALLVLKGKGKEQRIFSYENGKQIFW